MNVDEDEEDKTRLRYLSYDEWFCKKRTFAKLIKRFYFFSTEKHLHRIKFLSICGFICEKLVKY